MMPRPGDRVTIVRGGQTITEVVDSVTYRSPTPAIYRSPTRWQQIARRLTPARWRKPIPVVREAQPSRVEVKTVGVDAFERHRKALRELEKAIEKGSF
jgi:hypothetical protein